MTRVRDQGNGSQQLLPGDVAEADAIDQPFLAGLDQRRQLGVDRLPGAPD
jgi:hypothetical protein